LFFPDEIIIKEDGSAVLIGEERNSQFKGFQTSSIIACPDIIPTQRANPALNNKSTQLPIYDFRSIVVAEFDASGKRKWSTKIVKDQYSKSDDGIYFSYSVTRHDGNRLSKNLAFDFQKKGEEISYRQVSFPLVST